MHASDRKIGFAGFDRTDLSMSGCSVEAGGVKRVDGRKDKGEKGSDVDVSLSVRSGREQPAGLK